jgi:BCD family chlorophyll transporter-like MFS transporter
MIDAAAGMGWKGIFRVALVQTALGAVVVLTTSTMNRVMIVELALPAMLPGALVAFHYLVQMLRPKLGHASDVGGRRTPWIIGGMGLLALGGILASVATAWMGRDPSSGILLALFAFLLVGLGVGSAGTSLLALVAKQAAPKHRAPAATAMWTMMIFGFALTAGLAGGFLDPYSPERLVLVTIVVSVLAFLLAAVAIWNVERPEYALAMGGVTEAQRDKPPFRVALAEVWRETEARWFTIFVFVSMLAYSAQDLILEPFAGLVFQYTPGQSTQLSGLQNGGVLFGMLLVAFAAGSERGRRAVSLRTWTILGCLGSGCALASLAAVGVTGSSVLLMPSVVGLGFANGIFAIGAIASMMELAHVGRAQREGVRIGLWGAAQAIAYAIGGFAGAAGLDLARSLLEGTSTAFASVFMVESLLFVVAAGLAVRVIAVRAPADTRGGGLQFESTVAIGAGGTR